jgi:hypothetical protein
MAEKLLLVIQYECNRHKIEIPWESVAHRLHPGSSGGAILQHLARLRPTLVAEGHLVPPAPQKPGSKAPIDSTIRGYVRKDPRGSKTETRPVLFTEPWEDPKFNLPDANDVGKRYGDPPDYGSANENGGDDDNDDDGDLQDHKVKPVETRRSSRKRSKKQSYSEIGPEFDDEDFSQHDNDHGAPLDKLSSNTAIQPPLGNRMSSNQHAATAVSSLSGLKMSDVYSNHSEGGRPFSPKGEGAILDLARRPTAYQQSELSIASGRSGRMGENVANNQVSHAMGNQLYPHDNSASTFYRVPQDSYAPLLPGGIDQEQMYGITPSASSQRINDGVVSPAMPGFGSHPQHGNMDIPGISPLDLKTILSYRGRMNLPDNPANFTNSSTRDGIDHAMVFEYPPSFFRGLPASNAAGEGLNEKPAANILSQNIEGSVNGSRRNGSTNNANFTGKEDSKPKQSNPSKMGQ